MSTLFEEVDDKPTVGTPPVEKVSTVNVLKLDDKQDVNNNEFISGYEKVIDYYVVNNNGLTSAVPIDTALSNVSISYTKLVSTVINMTSVFDITTMKDSEAEASICIRDITLNVNDYIVARLDDNKLYIIRVKELSKRGYLGDNIYDLTLIIDSVIADGEENKRYVWLNNRVSDTRYYSVEDKKHYSKQDSVYKENISIKKYISVINDELKYIVNNYNKETIDIDLCNYTELTTDAVYGLHRINSTSYDSLWHSILNRNTYYKKLYVYKKPLGYVFTDAYDSSILDNAIGIKNIYRTKVMSDKDFSVIYAKHEKSMTVSKGKYKEIISAEVSLGDGIYVFSSGFYKRDYNTMTLLEKVVYSYLDHKNIKNKDIIKVCDSLVKLSDLSKRYYYPIMLQLMRNHA